MRSLIMRLARHLLRDELHTLHTALKFHCNQAGELTAQNTKLRIKLYSAEARSELFKNALRGRDIYVA